MGGDMSRIGTVRGGYFAKFAQFIYYSLIEINKSLNKIKKNQAWWRCEEKKYDYEKCLPLFYILTVKQIKLL